MVKNEKQHIEKTRAKQGFPADSPDPIKLRFHAFDFGAKILRPMVVCSRIDHVGEAGFKN